MNLENIKGLITNVTSHYKDRNIEEMFFVLKKLKNEAVNQKNEIFAKELWSFEEILKLQELYINAFNKMKNEDYYNAWCDLERAEIKYISLAKHTKETYKYKMYFMVNHIRKYYRIFPYKLFSSIEYINLESRCSICNKVIEFKKSCGHKIGEIYNGEMCCRLITKWELIGYSLVTNPLNKYTVVFSVDQNDKKVDNYDYSIVKYLIERLKSPFDGWDFSRSQKRISHKNYRKINKHDECPCGSEKTYKECCLKKDGVLSKHIDFKFEKDIPEHLKTIELPTSIKRKYSKLNT